MTNTAVPITAATLISLLAGVFAAAVWPAWRERIDARRRRKDQLRRVRRYHA